MFQSVNGLEYLSNNVRVLISNNWLNYINSSENLIRIYLPELARTTYITGNEYLLSNTINLQGLQFNDINVIGLYNNIVGQLPNQLLALKCYNVFFVHIWDLVVG